MKILIDTNICLDFITGRRPFFSDAKQLFEKLENSSLTAFASPDSFSNIFYILRKDYQQRKIIVKLKELRKLIFVGILSEKIIDLALDSGWKDFEDALQYYCAKENNCNAIITRNNKDFSKSALPVFTPLEFLEQFKPEEE